MKPFFRQAHRVILTASFTCLLVLTGIAATLLSHPYAAHAAQTAHTADELPPPTCWNDPDYGTVCETNW